MSTWSASGIRGTSYNSATLQALLEVLPLKLTTDNWTTIQSMASATFASLKSLSVTVELDELILFISQANISCGTVNEQAKFRHVIDSVAQTPIAYFFQRGAGDTAGEDKIVTLISYAENLAAGTKTFDLQWARNAGAGTIYSLEGKIHALRFKKR